MLEGLASVRALKFAVAVGAALFLAACANDKATTGAGDLASLGGGSATPGSSQAVATATLDKQAQWLNQYGSYKITIDGHADERGTREYNFALGQRRAQTTRDYLVSKGVAASRLSTKSWGKEKPVAVCDDISCWSQNRRAVTTLSGGN
jgi:peptidoglycan-associated lipoprotein